MTLGPIGMILTGFGAGLKKIAQASGAWSRLGVVKKTGERMEKWLD